MIKGGFLSQQELETIIEGVSRTRQGKEAIRKATGKKTFNFVARFDNSIMSAADKAQMKAKAEEMRDVLYQHIIADTQVDGRQGLATFSKDSIIIQKPKKVGNTGNYKIDILFDADALRRDSLDPDRYPDGITDIISLFVHGYNARGAVVGNWHGQDGVVSLRHRDPNNFMARAVAEFNSMHNDGSVIAVLEDKYQ